MVLNGMKNQMNVKRIVRRVATLPLRCAEKDLKYQGLKKSMSRREAYRHHLRECGQRIRVTQNTEQQKHWA